MTKTLAIALTLVMSQVAIAHELDNEQTVSAKQIELSKDLPQTVVVRIDKNDPSKVEVVHLKNKLAPGKKVANLKFEKMALNTEVTGIAYDSKNELDATSSTSSWGFAVVGGGRGGYGGYRGGYGYGGGYGYRAGYGAGYGYGAVGYGYNAAYYQPYYSTYYAPAYNYYGYNYAYQPYYGYSDNCYNYAYYGWNSYHGYY